MGFELVHDLLRKATEEFPPPSNCQHHITLGNTDRKVLRLNICIVDGGKLGWKCVSLAPYMIENPKGSADDWWSVARKLIKKSLGARPG